MICSLGKDVIAHNRRIYFRFRKARPVRGDFEPSGMPVQLRDLDALKVKRL